MKEKNVFAGNPHVHRGQDSTVVRRKYDENLKLLFFYQLSVCVVFLEGRQESWCTAAGTQKRRGTMGNSGTF